MFTCLANYEKPLKVGHHKLDHETIYLTFSPIGSINYGIFILTNQQVVLMRLTYHYQSTPFLLIYLHIMFWSCQEICKWFNFILPQHTCPLSIPQLPNKLETWGHQHITWTWISYRWLIQNHVAHILHKLFPSLP